MFEHPLDHMYREKVKQYKIGAVQSSLAGDTSVSPDNLAVNVHENPLHSYCVTMHYRMHGTPRQREDMAQVFYPLLTLCSSSGQETITSQSVERSSATPQLTNRPQIGLSTNGSETTGGRTQPQWSFEFSVRNVMRSHVEKWTAATGLSFSLSKWDMLSFAVDGEDTHKSKTGQVVPAETLRVYESGAEVFRMKLALPIVLHESVRHRNLSHCKPVDELRCVDLSGLQPGGFRLTASICTSSLSGTIVARCLDNGRFEPASGPSKTSACKILCLRNGHLSFEVHFEGQIHTLRSPEASGKLNDSKEHVVGVLSNVTNRTKAGEYFLIIDGETVARGLQRVDDDPDFHTFVGTRIDAKDGNTSFESSPSFLGSIRDLVFLPGSPLSKLPRKGHSDVRAAVPTFRLLPSVGFHVFAASTDENDLLTELRSVSVTIGASLSQQQIIKQHEKQGVWTCTQCEESDQVPNPAWFKKCRHRHFRKISARPPCSNPNDATGVFTVVNHTYEAEIIRPYLGGRYHTRVTLLLHYRGQEHLAGWLRDPLLVQVSRLAKLTLEHGDAAPLRVCAIDVEANDVDNGWLCGSVALPGRPMRLVTPLLTVLAPSRQHLKFSAQDVAAMGYTLGGLIKLVVDSFESAPASAPASAPSSTPAAAPATEQVSAPASTPAAAPATEQVSAPASTAEAAPATEQVSAPAPATALATATVDAPLSQSRIGPMDGPVPEGFTSALPPVSAPASAPASATATAAPRLTLHEWVNAAFSRYWRKHQLEECAVAMRRKLLELVLITSRNAATLEEVDKESTRAAVLQKAVRSLAIWLGDGLGGLSSIEMRTDEHEDARHEELAWAAEEIEWVPIRESLISKGVRPGLIEIEFQERRARLLSRLTLRKLERDAADRRLTPREYLDRVVSYTESEMTAADPAAAELVQTHQLSALLAEMMQPIAQHWPENVGACLAEHLVSRGSSLTTTTRYVAPGTTTSTSETQPKADAFARRSWPAVRRVVVGKIKAIETHIMIQRDLVPLLEQGLPLDVAPYGYSALYMACAQGNAQLVKFLMARGAMLHFPSKDGTRPIEVAAALGHFSIVHELWDHGAHLGRAAHYAAASGHLSILQLFIPHVIPADLAMTPPPTAVGISGDMSSVGGAPLTLLAVAMTHEQFPVARFLLAHGADAEKMPSSLRAERRLGLLQARNLLPRIAPPELAPPQAPQTLEWLLESMRPPRVDEEFSSYREALQDKIKGSAVDVDERDEMHWTALMYASVTDDGDRACKLLALGASVQARERFGFSSLLWAHWHKCFNFRRAIVWAHGIGCDELTSEDRIGYEQLSRLIESVGDDEQAMLGHGIHRHMSKRHEYRDSLACCDLTNEGMGARTPRASPPPTSSVQRRSRQNSHYFEKTGTPTMRCDDYLLDLDQRLPQKYPESGRFANDMTGFITSVKIFVTAVMASGVHPSGILPSHAFALHLYTRTELVDAINRAHRDGNRDAIAQWEVITWYVTAAHNVLAKEEGIYFRGASMFNSTQMRDYLPGAITTWSSFSRTTIDLRVAGRFLYGSSDPTAVEGVIFKIRAHTAASVAWCSLFPEEMEFLLIRDTCVRVINWYACTDVNLLSRTLTVGAGGSVATATTSEAEVEGGGSGAAMSAPFSLAFEEITQPVPLPRFDSPSDLKQMLSENQVVVIEVEEEAFHVLDQQEKQMRAAEDRAAAARAAREVAEALNRVGLTASNLEEYREGHKCSFWFVRADKLRLESSSKINSLPNLQMMRQQRGDWLQQLTISFEAGCRGEYLESVLVVSHCWESPEVPDVNGVQLSTIRQHVLANPKIQYVWYDFWCMPQGQGMKMWEKKEFEVMLPNINLLYLLTQVLILLDLSYMSRFWTQLEAYLSMRKLQSNGLVSTPNEERRYVIKCIHNAPVAFEYELTKMWAHKTVDEAYDVLIKPDVKVTNSKDKSVQLPKLKRLQEFVVSQFDKILYGDRTA